MRQAAPTKTTCEHANVGTCAGADKRPGGLNPNPWSQIPEFSKKCQFRTESLTFNFQLATFN